MSVFPSAPALEIAPLHFRTVAALVYNDEAFPQSTFCGIVAWCRSRNVSLAGVLQHPVAPNGDHRCDVVLEDLMSGHRTALFESRGIHARGCRLDESALAEVTARIERSLEKRPHLLILNKFGKAESEGRGLRDLIALAIDLGIPTIIGVPRRNLSAWTSFAGDLAVELENGTIQVDSWIAMLDLSRSVKR
jgi:hypothetical protein